MLIKQGKRVKSCVYVTVKTSQVDVHTCDKMMAIKTERGMREQRRSLWRHKRQSIAMIG